MRVLITGGSGYLGQFLIQHLSNEHDVAFTYLHNAVSPQETAAQAFKVNLATREGLQAAVLDLQPHIVVNCAAVSQPAACERDYEACKALNVPKQLVTALQQLRHQHGHDALLIHISTDQVYDGSRPDWREGDPTVPVNAYGRSKLEAEQHIQQEWPGRHVILRCSLIYGPEPPFQPVGRPLFVQFVEQVLAKGQETDFFTDEYRSAVYVYDICNVIQHIIRKYKPKASGEHSTQQQQQQQSDQHKQQQEHPSKTAADVHQQQPNTDTAAAAAAAGLTTAAAVAGDLDHACDLADLDHAIYNLGGPDRLSRYDMAAAVAQHCGQNTAAIKAARTADVQRGYTSPPDISMNTQQLLQDIPEIYLTSFSEGLKQIFPLHNS